MELTISSIWIIYVIIVLVIFILAWLFIRQYHSELSVLGIAFMASYVGAVAVIVASSWINDSNLTSGDRTSLSVLYTIAFLLPAIIIFYIIYFNRNSQVTI